MQCNPCGDVHSFRKPRGDVEDDVPEPIAAKKRAMMKKLTFEEFFAKHSDKNAKPYEFREHYHENVIVTHPKFGEGVHLGDPVRQQGRGDVQGFSARAGSQPEGHAGFAARRGRTTGTPSDTKVTKNGKVAGKLTGKVTAKVAPTKAAPPREGRPQGCSAALPPAKPAKPAAPARSPSPKAAVKTAPAAKAAKRTTKPARPVRTAAPRPRAAAKRPAKAAKRGKK